ncbi:site-specific tyrosine recombinase XerC [Pseudoruegeria aquimaris]|uniref:Site-specific tyrosine recombinase XerC n=1 Tax=Pseudoruegeria aquimaris TaxID=393663 RepID=A0A1Y5T684_9RHOB|nr:site-specific integrase [Pseudoruegeria aquimaris]SLN54852.1 site-specific tyrosine recombinase XerC [Pseudoruegeria aquimaris]
MTLAQELKDYLDTSGESRRALSLRAGLNPKAISDILNIPGLTPRHSTLVALSEATGRDLLNSAKQLPRTYADLISEAQSVGNKTLASRLKWLCRNAGWVPELKAVCKQEVIDFFDRHTPASLGLTKGSMATYRSMLLKAAGTGQSRQRKRRIDDIGGIYKDVHVAIRNSDLPVSTRLASGSFLLFLHDEGIQPSEISPETLADYYRHRTEVSAKGEKQCEKHVREIATLLRKLSDHPDFTRFGFAAAPHPFEGGRDKFGVNDAQIAPLLAEFDARVAPWATGQMSRDGMDRAAFIAMLDAMEQPVSDKKARLRNAKKARAARSGKPTHKSSSALMTDKGFLVGRDRWSEKTLARRRGYVISMAKAIVAATDVVPETIEELTDPEFLEIGAEALAESNKSDYPSGYVESVLKTMRKIASGFVCRPPEEVQEISDLISLHKPGFTGISPRNKAKLQQFTDDRIVKTIRLTGTIVTQVNNEIDRRRRVQRKKTRKLPAKADVMDAELIRDVMAALAHDILMTRAPRSDNVLRARLDWVSWHGDLARLTVPAGEVKMRSSGDADLPIPLSESTSRLLRTYLEVLRPRVLQSGDAQNPYLFPGHGKGRVGTHYSALLKRVTGLLARYVGVNIHPHLYRHLVGWIWLKDNPDHLPKVQRLLGHRSLQTTLDYYAELDEGLVLDAWQEQLNGKATGKTNSNGRKT